MAGGFCFCQGRVFTGGIDCTMVQGLVLDHEGRPLPKDQEQNQRIAALIEEATKLPGSLFVMNFRGRFRGRC